MTTPITLLLLAGGEGKRMLSATQKVLHPLCGLPMLEWVRRAAKLPDVQEPPIAVLAFGDDQVKERYEDTFLYVEQKQPRGSGSALLAAREELRCRKGKALILAGDLPLLRKDTVARLAGMDAPAAFLTAQLDDPYGYGRVQRDAEGRVVDVIEEEDLPEGLWTLHETRVSAYCFEIAALLPVLDALASAVGEGECSMGDILKAMIKKGAKVATIRIPEEEAKGVNDRVQLAECEQILRARINEAHMRGGVTLVDPAAAYIDATVKIGRDCTIYPGVVLEGNTVIEEGCTLYPACHVADSHFGRFVQARGVVAKDAVVGDYVTMGPYVHLRPGTRLANKVKVGNYIEVKNSVVGEGSKLPHLSYIGDGDVGSGVNLGCGTVFVNYDGYKKHRTNIGDGAFIGCHTSLVAPVTVGKGAFTAAGSVITEDVPDETLAVARAKQVNKIGYMSRLRAKRGDK